MKDCGRRREPSRRIRSPSLLHPARASPPAAGPRPARPDTGRSSRSPRNETPIDRSSRRQSCFYRPRSSRSPCQERSPLPNTESFCRDAAERRSQELLPVADTLLSDRVVRSCAGPPLLLVKPKFNERITCLTNVERTEVVVVVISHNPAGNLCAFPELRLGHTGLELFQGSHYIEARIIHGLQKLVDL